MQNFKGLLNTQLKIIAWITRSYARATLAVSQTPVSCLPRPHIVRHSHCRRQLTRNAQTNPQKTRCVVFETAAVEETCVWSIFYSKWPANESKTTVAYYTQDETVLFLLIWHLFIPRLDVNLSLSLCSITARICAIYLQVFIHLWLLSLRFTWFKICKSPLTLLSIQLIGYLNNTRFLKNVFK